MEKDKKIEFDDVIGGSNSKVLTKKTRFGKSAST